MKQSSSLVLSLLAGIAMVGINVWLGLGIFACALFDSKGWLFE